LIVHARIRRRASRPERHVVGGAGIAVGLPSSYGGLARTRSVRRAEFHGVKRISGHEPLVGDIGYPWSGTANTTTLSLYLAAVSSNEPPHVTRVRTGGPARVKIVGGSWPFG
jgi:hypothetical protein